MTEEEAAPSTRAGDRDRCPVCGAMSGVVADDDGYSCAVCGAPRVLVTMRVERPHAEKSLLEAGARIRSRRAAWGVAAGIATLVAAIGLVVWGIVGFWAHAGAPIREALGLVTFAPALFAALGFASVAHLSRRLRRELDAATLVVTEELVRARAGTLDSAELAVLLAVPIERAEMLLARAQVDDLLEDDARAENAPRLRVNSEPDAPTEDDESRASRRDRTER